MQHNSGRIPLIGDSFLWQRTAGTSSPALSGGYFWQFHSSCNARTDVYAIIANEDCRPQALGIIQELREAGYRVDYPLTAAKIGKQFQNAEHLGAAVTVLFGEEWPQVKVKTLASRQELLIEHTQLASTLSELLTGS